jgi:hypothetical protein
MILFYPLPYMFMFLFAPILLLLIIGFFGLIRLIIKENRKKKDDSTKTE